MSGYDGYSMSNRARRAYADGKMPLSKIRKRDLEENGIDVTVSQFKRAVELGVIDASEWHHTSKRYNKTKFFDLPGIYEALQDGELTLDEIRNPNCVYERDGYRPGCVRCGEMEAQHKTRPHHDPNFSHPRKPEPREPADDEWIEKMTNWARKQAAERQFKEAEEKRKRAARKTDRTFTQRQPDRFRPRRRGP